MDAWADWHGYEAFMGRWSRLVAGDFLAWPDPPPGRRWVDVGSGTGALSQRVLELAAPATVLGIDRSAVFMKAATTSFAGPPIHFVVGDAEALPVPGGSLDFAVSGLALNFVLSPATAVAEMARVVRPGGTVAFYVWDYAEGMRLLRHFWDAAVQLDPQAARLDEGRRFPICRPDRLSRLLGEAGLADGAVRPIEVPTRFAGFEDLWRPFLGGQGPAPGYVASLDEAARSLLETSLPPRRRQARTARSS